DSVHIHPTLQRPTKTQLCEIVRDFEVVICGIHEKFDSDVAACSNHLKIIATLSVGVDHIDTNEFSRRGVHILNLPDYNAISVSEHALALILGLAKQLAEADELVRNRGSEDGYYQPIVLYQQ